MIKKIVLSALLLIPAIGFAQEKIAYVRYDEIVQLMPEYKQMMDSLEKEQTNYLEQLQADREEYNKKLAEYTEKRESLSETLRNRREQDLIDMQERMSNFQQQIQLALQQLQQNLLKDIIAKVDKTLEEIAVQNHYSYVLDGQALHYVSPQSVNATPLIKAKLGLKDAPITAPK